MELIAGILFLIAAAILYPEGTRAFVVFVVKATAVVAVIGVLVSMILLMVGTAISKSEEPVPKLASSEPRCVPTGKFITLDDGTKIDLVSNCD